MRCRWSDERALFSYCGVGIKPFSVGVPCRIIVLSAVSVSRRNMASEALASGCQLRGLIFGSAATVPTRWPAPRPDEGRRSAAPGGSRWLAISCGSSLLTGPAERAGVTPHPMEDHGQLASDRNRGLFAAEVFAQHEIGCELKAMSQWLDGQ